MLTFKMTKYVIPGSLQQQGFLQCFSVVEFLKTKPLTKIMSSRHVQLLTQQNNKTNKPTSL